MASLAFAMFGIGCLIGSPLLGYINDKFDGGRAVSKACLAMHIVSFLITIAMNEVHEYGFLTYITTFVLGMQDAFMQNQVPLVMGNEFDTLMEPFAIFRLYNSLGIAATMTVISFITTISAYRIFLIACLVISIGSQAVMIFWFPFRPKLSK